MFTTAALTQGLHTICVEARVGGNSLPQFCCTFDVFVLPVTGLTCADVGGGTIDASWTNAAPYDAINVYVDGVLDATLGGADIGYSVVGLPVPSTVDICIEPVAFGNVAAQVCCTQSVNAAADLEECSTPVGVNLGDDTLGFPPTAQDILTVVGSIALADVQISIDMTYAFVGDLQITVTSPAATAVQLHENGGGGVPGLNLTWWTNGVPNGTPDYNSGNLQQPAPDPFSMLSWLGEDTAGDWTMDLVDTFPATGGGTLNGWCLRGFLTGGDFPANNLVCNGGFGNGIVDASWTNNGTYDEIGVFIDGIESRGTRGHGDRFHERSAARTVEPAVLRGATGWRRGVASDLLHCGGQCSAARSIDLHQRQR